MPKQDRLTWFIETLQKTLGWQIDVEKRSKDRTDYEVVITFHLKYTGRVWREIVANPDYRDVVLAAVRHQLYQLWDKEAQDLAAEAHAKRRKHTPDKV